MEDDRLYNFLKEDYKKGFDVDFDNDDEIITALQKMIEKVKERQNKLFDFFGVKKDAAPQKP